MPDLIDARSRFVTAAATTRPMFNVATTDRAATVHIYGAIGDWFDGVEASRLVPEIAALDADTITVHLNSPGGDVYDGIAIRNALRQHAAPVTIVVDGLAASAASVIATAGDDVVMSDGAELMIHDAWRITIGNADELRAEADDLDRISDNIAAMYATKGGGDAATWRAAMKAETWYSAAEAVAVGLADRTDTPTAAPAAAFDLSMFTYAGRAAASAPIPAAAMAPNRKDTTPMDPITLDQLDTRLGEQSDTFNRTLETRLAAFSGGAPDPGPSWPTFGHFLKDLVGGSEKALAFYETRAAYDGATTADDKQPNTWVRDAIHLIQRTRRILGTFSTEPLPADGMTLEYLQLKSNSITVGKQAAQGDALVKGKVQLKSSTTPVETYGGWTELSRQIIDRASAAYLNTANTAMTLEYARATEQVVRDLLKGIIAEGLGTAQLSIAANANAYAWLDLIVDAAGLFDDNSYTLDGGLVSIDVFKKLIRLEDTNGNSLMRVWGNGTNQVGELDLTGIKGSLASVEFRILPGADANTIEFHDRIGITTWESPGAPFRLQDTNTINLTESMSQYGYLAAASQFPDAIQPVEVTGAP